MVTKELYDHIDALSDALTNFHFNDDSVVILFADFEGYDRTGSINGPTDLVITRLAELMKMMVDNCDDETKTEFKRLLMAAVREM